MFIIKGATKMMRKKLLAVGMMLIMLLVSACGTNDSKQQNGASQNAAKPIGEEKFDYIFGHGAAEKSIGDLYCHKFKELVEAKSGGAITVEVYSGNQLGTYGEMMQSLQNGDIGGMIFQPSPAVSFVPELAVLDIPYAFLGMKQDKIDKVLNNSKYADILRKSFADKGYKYVSMAQAASFRETTSNKEIHKVEDFQGLKIRTLENNNHIEFWKSIGANPTPIAFGELYLSLQQHLVDAQENPYDTALNAGFPEVQKYLVETHHILYPNIFLVNKAKYDSMPDNYKKVFDEAAAEAKKYAEDVMKKSAVDDRKKMIAAGMQDIELDQSVLQKLKEMSFDKVTDQVRSQVGDSTMQAFLEALKN